MNEPNKRDGKQECNNIGLTIQISLYVRVTFASRPTDSIMKLK